MRVGGWLCLHVLFHFSWKLEAKNIQISIQNRRKPEFRTPSDVQGEPLEHHREPLTFPGASEAPRSWVGGGREGNLRKMAHRRFLASICRKSRDFDDSYGYAKHKGGYIYIHPARLLAKGLARGPRRDWLQVFQSCRFWYRVSILGILILWLGTHQGQIRIKYTEGHSNI